MKFWESGTLQKWFRPESGFYREGEQRPWERMKALYGEDLRSGNEDLDPYARFESWTKTMPYEDHYDIIANVRFGFDKDDAEDHGELLRLPLRCLGLFIWNEPLGQPCHTLHKLLGLGFDLKGARKMSWGTYTDFSTKLLPVVAAAPIRRCLVVEEEVAEVDSEWAAAGRKVIDNGRLAMQELAAARRLGDYSNRVAAYPPPVYRSLVLDGAL